MCAAGYLVHCISLIDYFECILVHFHELIVIRVRFHTNRCASVHDLDFQLFARCECHRLLLYWEFAAAHNSETERQKTQFAIKIQFKFSTAISIADMGKFALVICGFTILN